MRYCMCLEEHNIGVQIVQTSDSTRESFTKCPSPTTFLFNLADGNAITSFRCRKKVGASPEDIIILVSSCTLITACAAAAFVDNNLYSDIALDVNLLVNRGPPSDGTSRAPGKVWNITTAKNLHVVQFGSAWTSD